MRITRIAACLFAVVSLVSGCIDDPKTDTGATTSESKRLFQYWPPLLNDFRFRWSAEPGIDLTTGPAMVVRAYVEAYGVATFTVDASNVYPGFMRATPENLTFKQAELLQQTYVRPLGEGYPTTPKGAVAHFGYEINHFLELVPQGAGWEAIVCTGSYPHFVASRVRPGKFVAVNADAVTGEPYKGGDKPEDLGVYPVRITLTQHDPRIGPDAPGDVTTPQKGPAFSPDLDVFGNWFITAASFGGWGPKGDTKSLHWRYPEPQNRCNAVMPQNAAERRATITGFRDTPPPHGDAIPGWPLPIGDRP
ncbi:hypothetical protein [Mycolicibacterium sp. lyk4-40-TYG-92]|jgi:hypothetical protein|uniref:hypothetical protein n=1 Tax=Mycolicibacterium sp. lyk4-40-TYG-92 TaxID=3040295 RepID=UPI00254B51D2|nr:hypothetical protein [Mycolicibacterium sp. lyk4-40-TYG-92]